MSLLQPFPNSQTPLVNTQTGVVEKIWRNLLSTLWVRTGSGQGDGVRPSITNTPAVGEVLLGTQTVGSTTIYWFSTP